LIWSRSMVAMAFSTLLVVMIFPLVECDFGFGHP
jgi:hypothetical protein